MKREYVEIVENMMSTQCEREGKDFKKYWKPKLKQRANDKSLLLLKSAEKSVQEIIGESIILRTASADVPATSTKLANKCKCIHILFLSRVLQSPRSY